MKVTDVIGFSHKKNEWLCGNNCLINTTLFQIVILHRLKYTIWTVSDITSPSGISKRLPRRLKKRSILFSLLNMKKHLYIPVTTFPTLLLYPPNFLDFPSFFPIFHTLQWLFGNYHCAVFRSFINCNFYYKA